jgi:hypothetical protein
MRGDLRGLDNGNVASRSFRAAGMNRTLNQPVVIDGSFQEPPQPDSRTNALRAMKAEATQKAEAEKPVDALQPVPLPRVQIQGRVLVGDRQELIINAVPVNR